MDSEALLVQPATKEILGQLDSPAKLAQSVHAETRVPWAKVVRRGLMAKLVKQDSEAKLAQLAQPDQRVQMVFKAKLGSKDTLAKTRALAPQVPQEKKEQLVLLETQVLLALKAQMELKAFLAREVLSERAAIRALKVLRELKEPRVLKVPQVHVGPKVIPAQLAQQVVLGKKAQRAQRAIEVQLD